jgi:hypothetical protein
MRDFVSHFTVIRRKEVKGERIEFMIIIIIGNDIVLPNAFPMLREYIGNLLQVIFYFLIFNF